MHRAKNRALIIPWRAGSKGLPNKNIAVLDGKPLTMHAVDLAKMAKATRIKTKLDEADLRNGSGEGWGD